MDNGKQRVRVELNTRTIDKKKVIASICFVVPILLILVYFAFFSAPKSFEDLSDADKMYEIYMTASSSGGYQGTYEEWLDSIAGKSVELDYIVESDGSICLKWRQLTLDNDGNVVQGSEGEWQTLMDMKDYFVDDIFEVWIAHREETGQNTNGLTVDDMLKSIYSVKEFTITYRYDSNISDLSSTQDKGEQGTTIEEPTISIKSSYTAIREFVGWYIYDTDTKWDFNVHVLSKDIILEAKYIYTSHNVEYKLEGGVNSEQNITSITAGETFTLKAPTKEGYDFSGWFIGDSKKTELSEIRDTVILTAKWVAKVYDVRYVLDTGVSESFGTYTYDSDYITLSSESINKIGEEKGYKILSVFSDSSRSLQISEGTSLLTITMSSNLVVNDQVTLYTKCSLYVNTDRSIQYAGYTWRVLTPQVNGIYTVICNSAVRTSANTPNDDPDAALDYYFVTLQASYRTDWLVPTSDNALINFPTVEQANNRNLYSCWVLDNGSLKYKDASGNLSDSNPTTSTAYNIYPVLTINSNYL